MEIIEGFNKTWELFISQAHTDEEIERFNSFKVICKNFYNCGWIDGQAKIEQTVIDSLLKKETFLQQVNENVQG